MPLLGYNGGLPLDFWDLSQALFEMMKRVCVCLTALLATGSIFQDASLGVKVVAGQYLLGLGTGDITG